MKQIILLLGIFLFLGCSSSRFNNEDNSKESYIDILDKECTSEHNLNSCISLGDYYLEKSKKNNKLIDKALYYYDNGCLQLYDDGIMFKNINLSKNMHACIKEAEIIKDKKKLSIFDVGKLKAVADYFYKNSEYKRAKDYYLLLVKRIDYSDVYYNLSDSILKTKNDSLEYIEESKKYFFLYLIKEIVYNNKFFYEKITKIKRDLECKITIYDDERASKVEITNLSVNNPFYSHLLKELNKKVFKPIPKEYKINTTEFIVKYKLNKNKKWMISVKNDDFISTKDKK